MQLSIILTYQNNLRTLKILIKKNSNFDSTTKHPLGIGYFN
jgi:hypothetical protein